jgi:AcrR family transcriptional regulator
MLKYWRRKHASFSVLMVKRQSYHHGDLRQALINAAVELLTEDGIHHLSLRQVARRVGVSHAAPYRHFEDKDELLAVVAEEGFKAFTEYLQTAVNEAPEDPIQQFLGCGCAYVRYALEHPTHYRLMFSEFPFCENRFESLNRVADASFGVIVDVIARGQKQGLFQAGDERLMALGAWTQVHGLSLLLLAGRLGIQGEEAVDQMTEALGRTMLQGVAATGVCDGGEPKADT